MSLTSFYAQIVLAAAIISALISKAALHPCPDAIAVLNEFESNHMKGLDQWSSDENDPYQKKATVNAALVANNCADITERLLVLLGNFSAIVHTSPEQSVVNHDFKSDLKKVKAKIISFLYDLTSVREQVEQTSDYRCVLARTSTC